jgi:hypothetical protein
MFLNGSVQNENQVLSAWSDCFTQAGWTVTSSGARHPDNSAVGVDWTTNNIQYYYYNLNYFITFPWVYAVIIPILPVYYPAIPSSLSSIGNLAKGFYFGKKVSRINSSPYYTELVNNFSYPASWTCHYDTSTKELFWQMNDGYTTSWFACGIDQTTLKNPEATGFWFWSTCMRNYTEITQGFNAWPTMLMLPNEADYAYNRSPQEQDNLPGGLYSGTANFINAINRDSYTQYGPYSTYSALDGRYRLWPVRYFVCYKPDALTNAGTWLAWEAQTLKHFRSSTLNVGDSFNVGLDTYCWYPMMRRTSTEVLDTNNMIGYTTSGNTNNPLTGNYGVAVKKTT